MKNEQAQIKALKLIIHYLQAQNVAADLQLQGFDTTDIEQVQQAYVEFVDVTKITLVMWEDN